VHGDRLHVTSFKLHVVCLHGVEIPSSVWYASCG
jgi:hypothetical protein